MTKCRALTAEGITAHNWCGSYSLPVATITGSVRREVCSLVQHCSAGSANLRQRKSGRRPRAATSILPMPASG